jgi:hypothetical protein
MTIADYIAWFLEGLEDELHRRCEVEEEGEGE